MRRQRSGRPRDGNAYRFRRHRTSRLRRGAIPGFSRTSETTRWTTMGDPCHPRRTSFGRRAFTSRSGAIIDFTELGFGSAPVANLYRAVDEDDGAADHGGGLGRRGALFRHRAALRPRPGGNAPQPFLARQAAGGLCRLDQGRPPAAACPPDERTGIGKFFETPSRQEVFDYSYDGVMRSVEFSLERLGLDSIDILFAHDVDVFTHGSQEAADRRIAGVHAVGYGALEQAARRGRGEGDRRRHQRMAGRPRSWPEPAISTCSCSPAATRCSNRRRWTASCPIASRRSIGIVLGGPYNSGILATGAEARRLLQLRACSGGGP